MEKYDVLIIGAGVIGTSVARYLSRFKVNACVLEKHNDVGDETTNANSAIVHSGYDPKPDTVKAKFNVLGNKMMPKLCKELDVPFIKNGSITVGFNEEDVETINMLHERAKANGVTSKIVNKEELKQLEPNLSDKAVVGLYCEDSGIVSPFNLCVSLMENAMDNGVKLHLNEEVKDIKKLDGYYKVITSKNEYEAKAVVNCTGVNGDVITSMLEEPKFKIIPRKGEYIVLDHFNDNWIKHTLFMCPTKLGKGVLVSPTTSRNYIVGPSSTLSEKDDTSTDSETFAFLKETAAKLVDNIPYQFAIREFCGVRPNPDCEDFIIEESKFNENFFNVSGIMSPGLASSPAIGEYVSNLVKEKLHLEENKEFKPTIRKHVYKPSGEELNKLIKEDKKFGHIICRCETVSEGQIIDVIHRNCGATTIKGVKKRIRPGFGRCQGTFCQEEVLKILARELHKTKDEILYNELGTNVLKYPSKKGE